MFEGIAITLPEHYSNTQASANMIRWGWQAKSDIMNRAVQRGLSHRTLELSQIGIDEKIFKSGQQNIASSRVPDVADDRTTEVTKMFLQTLMQSQRNAVASVSVDMWKPFASAVKKFLQQAGLVHDQFHISKYLNNAVDIVRGQESRQLYKVGGYQSHSINLHLVP